MVDFQEGKMRYSPSGRETAINYLHEVWYHTCFNILPVIVLCPGQGEEAHLLFWFPASRTQADTIYDSVIHIIG